MRVTVDPRYARQIAVREVGEQGQAAFQRASVRVEGDGPDAELCALYLAGAGIGRIELVTGLVSACRALNSGVELCPFEGGGAFSVATGGSRYVPPEEPSPVARGSRAARWVLEQVLVNAARPRPHGEEGKAE